MVVPKPVNISDWLVWGNLTESVLIRYEMDVWDEENQEYYIEIEHRPTNLMRWVHQIENNKEPTYDRTSDTYKVKFPMKKVAIVKARTDGDYILMLCDYKGKTTNLVEIINKRVWNENEKLRKELKSANALSIRTQKLLNLAIEHPEQFEKKYIKRMMKIRQATAPAVISGTGVEGGMDDSE
jgi:hypothetical protein|tara:strand:- start:2170 stop:2715 length:546 start_codon:yes stop_codon:yes gene_type:complete